MRTTFHKLVGKRVYDARGTFVGRITDLRADNVAGQLRVTGLLVGQAHMLARFVLTAAEVMVGGRVRGYFVPWDSIGELGEGVKLKVGREELTSLSTLRFMGEKA